MPFSSSFLMASSPSLNSASSDEAISGAISICAFFPQAAADRRRAKTRPSPVKFLETEKRMVGILCIRRNRGP